MPLRQLWTSTALLSILMFLIQSSLRCEAQTVGKVGAVNPDATSTPPGGASRTLSVGANLVFKERIKTAAQGTAHITFSDQSTLNVGRNSNVVIDEYVYNPKTGTGTMVASISKGALRFVGGQISHTAGATLKTPVATLAVRGGIATIMYPVPASYASLDPSLAGCGGELVIGHVGIIKLQNQSGTTMIRPGFAACANGANIPITAPFRIADVVLANVVTGLASGPGQIGGAVTLPAQPFIIREGLGNTKVRDPTHPPGSEPLGRTSITNVGNGVAQSKSQTTQTQSTMSPMSPTITTPTTTNINMGGGGGTMGGGGR